jgi:arabinofuranan 3-O-arabinosyltransferase
MTSTGADAVEAAAPTASPYDDRREKHRGARLLMWAGLTLALFSLPFLSLPGRYVNDTRDALWLDPSAYLAHAFQLWHSSPYLGFEQHDGIVFPMAAIVWLLRAIGLSTWAAERVWHGMLLFGSATFTILLVDHLRGRRSVAAPLLAGLIYALTPFAFGYGLPFTGTFLAYVVLPLLVLIVLIGVRHPGLLWPAVFGLATFLMGGGNGAPQVYALVVCAALLAWLAAFDRTVRIRDAALFGGLALAFFVALNASWLFLLTSGEIQNALRYSEAPKVINVDSSVAESIRGVGLWLFYGGDSAGPWVPSVRPFLAAPALIVATFLVPVAAFVAAWRTRWRLRLFFALLAILSVFVVSGIFPVTSPTPFGRLLSWAYTHVPGVGGLRTTYKFSAAIELSLAVLVGMGVDPAIAAIRRVRRPALALAGVATLTFGAIAADGYPLWSGHLYAARASMPGIPDYWKRALADLRELQGQTRAFFAPAIDKATYRWGALKEGVTADAPNLATVVPIPLPVGERYGSNLLRATEEPYAGGTDADSTAILMRYLGVSAIVLQNDLDWHLTHTARPFSLQTLAHAKDLRPGATYGAAGKNVVGPPSERSDPFARFERRLHPVQILHVVDPRQIVRAEPSPPVVLSGDGFGLASAASAGLLASNPAVLYSGTMSPAEIATAAREGARFVVTDSNRRRVWSFTTAQGHASATLAIGRTAGGRGVGYGLFAGRPSTQTVAIYPGLRSIRSSTDGTAASWAPQYRPSLAFDGDPSTWWVAGPADAAAGSWIEADLATPRSVSSVTITLPPTTVARPIDQVRIDLSTGTRLIAAVNPGGTTTVHFPPARVDSIRITVVGIAPSLAPDLPVAITDIGIPGIRPTEIIRTPTDLFDAARATPGGLAALARAPLTYVFERARTTTAADRDEETAVARRFEIPGAASFVLDGTARLNVHAPDQAIDRFLNGPSPVVVTSSSRLLDDPRVRGSAAFDANPATAWVPEGTVGQWLATRFPVRRLGSFTVVTDTRRGHTPITGMKAELSDGTTVVGHTSSVPGVIRFDFSARPISSVKLTVTSVYASGGTRIPPIAIRSVDMPGVQITPVPADTPLPCTSADATIDGAPIALVARGTVGQALAGITMSVGTCHKSRLGLAGGTHDLRFGGALQPELVTLSSSGEGGGAGHPSPPRISWASSADGRYTVHIREARAPFYLIIGQNYSAGWRASVGSQGLGPPILLDGYSAGWLVDRPGTYTIDVQYGPQRLYEVALAVTTISLALAVLFVLTPMALGVLRRRKAKR